MSSTNSKQKLNMSEELETKLNEIHNNLKKCFLIQKIKFYLKLKFYSKKKRKLLILKLMKLKNFWIFYLLNFINIQIKLKAVETN